MENRNAQAMSKQASLPSVGRLKSDARSPALQDLQSFNTLLSVVLCTGSGNIIYSTRVRKNSLPKSIVLADSSGGHFLETNDLPCFAVGKQLSVTNQLIH